MSKENTYTFGMCKICKEHRPLKNGICPECERKQSNINFFEDLFGGKL